MKHNSAIHAQLKNSEGIFSVKTTATSLYTYYTLTSWESREHMLRFMRSGAHGQAMRDINKIADKAKSFGYEANTLPSWKEAQKMINDGKAFSYV